jgi:hypothetical protein
MRTGTGLRHGSESGARIRCRHKRHRRPSLRHREAVDDRHARQAAAEKNLGHARGPHRKRLDRAAESAISHRLADRHRRFVLHAHNILPRSLVVKVFLRERPRPVRYRRLDGSPIIRDCARLRLRVLNAP